VPFSELVDRAVHLDSTDLAVPSFSEDTELHREDLSRFMKHTSEPSAKVKAEGNVTAQIPYLRRKEVPIPPNEDVFRNTASVRLSEGYNYGKATKQEGVISL
jgi:hypothetical protein